MLNRVRLALRGVFLGRHLDREMQDEMELHLAQATARLMARGLTESEARRAARQEFGNVDYLQEQSRDARGSRWIESTRRSRRKRNRRAPTRNTQVPITGTARPGDPEYWSNPSHDCPRRMH